MLALVACEPDKPQPAASPGTPTLNAAERALVGATGVRVWRWQSSTRNGSTGANPAYVEHSRYILTADRRYHFLGLEQGPQGTVRSVSNSGRWAVVNNQWLLYNALDTVPYFTINVYRADDAAFVYGSDADGVATRTTWVPVGTEAIN
jgi:hypothetical protein